MVDINELNIPPTNVQAERAILGTYLQDITSFYSSILRGNYFYDSFNKEVFEYLQKLAKERKQPNHITFGESFPEKDHMFFELISEVPMLGSVEELEHIVVDCYTYRTMLEATKKIQNMCYTKKDLGEIRPILSALQVADVDTEKPEYLVKGSLDMMMEEHQEPELICSTGFACVDSYIQGFNKGEMIIVAGRPGTGKSTVVLNRCDNVLQSGIQATIFSVEMSARQIQKRFVCMKAGISSLSLVSQTEEDTQKIMTMYGSIDYTTDCSIHSKITDFEMVVRNIYKEISLGTKVIFIDYLQRIPDNSKNMLRTHVIGAMTGKLKSIALNNNVCIVVCAQLNRDIEKRPNRQPLLADLRDCGEIEQDADVVIMLDSEDERLLDVYIRKNRNGPANIVNQMKRDTKYFTFTNI